MTLAFDKAIIYGNVALSEAVFSTQSFSKKVFVLGKLVSELKD